MSFFYFWRRDFEVLFTAEGRQRLSRLVNRLEGNEDSLARVIDRALALYAKAVDWESNPVFRKDSNGEFEPCQLGKYVLGPCGLYAYRHQYYCSWSEWRVIQRLLAKSQDGDLFIMIERALELLEITLDHKLPQLYTFNNQMDFEPTKLPLDATLI